MSSNTFNWIETKQLSKLPLFLAFAIPSAIAYLGFHFILPMLVNTGIPVMIAWPTIASLMLLILVAASITFIRKEAKQLNITLTARMCLKPLSLKQWGKYLLLLVIGLIVVMSAAQLVFPFMEITGINIPSYMPFFLDPSIDPTKVDSEQISPGFPLKGQLILLPLMAITLLLNILAEELYFRAWLLPKMSQYGNKAWILNAVLFALYHTYQFWLFPTILAGSLLMAFVIYKSKSIWPALAAHLIGNFLLTLLGVGMLVLS